MTETTPETADDTPAIPPKIKDRRWLLCTVLALYLAVWVGAVIGLIEGEPILSEIIASAVLLALLALIRHRSLRTGTEEE